MDSVLATCGFYRISELATTVGVTLEKLKSGMNMALNSCRVSCMPNWKIYMYLFSCVFDSLMLPSAIIFPHLHSPAVSSVTTFILSKVGGNEVGGL